MFKTVLFKDQEEMEELLSEAGVTPEEFIRKKSAFILNIGLTNYELSYGLVFRSEVSCPVGCTEIGSNYGPEGGGANKYIQC